MISVIALYGLSGAQVHNMLKTLPSGCCLFLNEILLWSIQMLVSTLAVGTATSWVLDIVLTACVMKIVLRSSSECSEMKISPCLGRSDETPVVLVALPAKGC